MSDSITKNDVDQVNISNCESVNPDDVEELFHWNNDPEDKTKSCNDILKDKQAISSDPVAITNFFVVLISDYLSDPNNIQNSDLRELIMSKPVEVTSMSNFDTDKAGATPRVLVEFGGKQAQQNFAFGNKTSYNMHNSSTDYYTHWQIALSLYVIGNTLNETILLAEEVGNFCHCFQSDICNTAGFLRCQLAEISKPQCLQESGTQTAFLSTISISIVTAYTWTIIRQAPVLKRVTFKTTANGNLNKEL